MLVKLSLKTKVCKHAQLLKTTLTCIVATLVFLSSKRATIRPDSIGLQTFTCL